MKLKRFPQLTIVLLIVFNVHSYSQFEIKSAFPNLTFNKPVDLQNADDGSNRLFVVELDGKIKVFKNSLNVSSAKVFLDIEDRVSSGFEMGLLGLAFHPDYKENGYFYVNYTINNPRQSRISRFTVSSSNPDSADKNSELILLTVDQPYDNHNGGQLAFGNDGYLYASFGDGGSGQDPLFKGQNNTTFLGKILRIDVDNTENGLSYSIPPDNPFTNSTGNERKEIFATGLRNPWRFSIDRVTGKIWCGDVGQEDWEEISIIDKGKNYGWSCREGFDTGFNLSLCNDEDYTPPIWVYNHNEGRSITGGYVYRGVNIPELYGKYIYGDYATRKIWALEYDGINQPNNQYLFSSSNSITSFGIDEDSEIYFTTYGNPSSNSKIYKIVKSSPIEAPTFLTVILNGVGINLLQWEDNSDNESGFKIERKSKEGDFEEIASVSANQTTYLDLNLLNPSNHKYRVYAYNDEATSSYSNESSVIITSTPVELINFTAKVKGENVQLEWTTSSEINNKIFEIERFTNDFWRKIGSVEGKGTTSTKNIYKYFDNLENLFYTGIIKYRLKQIDFDGTFTYSNETSVEVNLAKKNYSLEQNFPNPFNPSTTIKFTLPEESKVKIRIYNVLGKEVFSFKDEIKTAGTYRQEWNAENLTSGVYYIELLAQSMVSDKNFSKVIKAIFIK